MSVEPRALKELFLAALAVAPAQRADWLFRECGQDEELRQRVELMLAAHETPQSLLDRLAPVGHPPEGSSGVRTAPATQAAAPPGEEAGTVLAGRYKLIEAIGEGGMGSVWMAQQTEPVKRLVAVKLIKAGMDSQQVIARFEAERQALALMDHPNIARVLDAGTSSAGRPYFVMDLVKGVPITRYCDEHHLTPRQRLELFIPVCEAVQHAHQKGIIHRDLKPSNVLVALCDGRPVPKVIDFGVAKAAGQPLTEKTLVTGLGSIVGTLEYMSPEQAELNQLDIDTRSDIYSLGVLLYELLTGSVPFSRKELEEVGLLEMLRVIREQEPTRPSTKLSTAEGLPTLAANRGMEPAKLTRLVRGELDWIVLKALEKDRNRRYETPNAFAMDVQRYLNDESVLACPPSAGYRLRKFARRNKAALAVAGLVLFFLVLLGSGIGWAVRERAEVEGERTERQRRLTAKVELFLADVDRLMAEQKWPEALNMVLRAVAVLTAGAADESTRQRARELLKDLKFIDRLEQIRMERARWVAGTFDTTAADRKCARAFREYGVDVERLPARTAIERLKTRPALAVPLAAALDDWVDARRFSGGWDGTGWDRLVTVAVGIDDDPMRNRLRAAWGQKVTPKLQADLRRLARSMDVRTQHPATLASLGRTLERAKLPDSAVHKMRQARFAHPGDFWINYQLSAHLSGRKDYEGAIRFLTAADSIRPNLPVVLNDLGTAYSEQKKLDEAIDCFQKAIDLDPKFVLGHTNLGEALREQGKLDEAIARLRKALELDPKFALAHDNLGTTYADQKKVKEAIDSYNKAIELDPKFASPHHNLAILLASEKKLPEAIASFQKAIKLDPTFVNAHNDLGALLCDHLQEYDKAMACFRKAIELDPKCAVAHTNVGNVLWNQGKLDESIDWFRKALQLNPNYALAHNQLGVALDSQKKLNEAIDCYRKAIVCDPKLVYAHRNLGNALREQGKLDEAIDCYQKAIQIDPTHIDTHIKLGTGLQGQGRVDEAIDCYRRVIKLDPKNAPAHFNLGKALRDKDQLDEAIDCYQKAIALDPKDAKAHVNLGAALCRKGQLDKAIDCFKKAIAVDPKDATAHYNLGNALLDKGQVDEAIDCFQKAIELDPKDAPAHHNLGIALLDRGQVAEAIDCFRKAIAFDRTSAKTHYNLGKALADKGQVEEAIDRYKEAIALDPKYAAAYGNLGIILCDVTRDYDGAIDCFQKAIALRPKDTIAHFNLGNALAGKGKVDDAIDCFQKAIALDPKYAPAHSNLGGVLYRKGEREKAIDCFKKAVALDPKFASTHFNLGVALQDQGQVDEAIECFRKASELDPKNAPAHFNLGTALAGKGHRDEAIDCFRKVIALDPKNAPAHYNLGKALHRKGELDRAIECFKKAIALVPKHPDAHYNLGNVLKDKGRLDEAIDCFRKAIEIAPKFAEAHCNLGDALRCQGRFAESLKAYKRGHELGTRQRGWRYPSAEWVRQGARLAALEARLLDFLQGDFHPRDTSERLALIGVCRAKKFYHAAARLYADSFAADAKLAGDVMVGHRYNAACYSALAASGQGDDAGKLSASDRLALRRRALTWLRADLALWSRLVASGDVGRSRLARILTNWQKDSALVGVRDQGALDKLWAEERSACARLWADVAALLKKSESAGKQVGER